MIKPAAMKSICTILLFTAASTAAFSQPAPAAQAWPASPRFVILISAVNPTVKAGTEIRIHVVLKNVSNKAMWVSSPGSSYAEVNYTVQVRDMSGKDAPETEYGHAARTKGLFTPSVMKMLLQPGETMQEDAVLGKLFDLSTPGDYEVQLSRAIQDDPKGGTVKSNKITITVLPADTPPSAPK